MFGPRPRPTGVRPDSTTAQASILWYELEPRVVTIGQTDSVRVVVAVEGIPTTVQLLVSDGAVALERQPDGRYAGQVALSDLLFGYRTGDLHNRGSVIHLVDASSTLHRRLVTTNVKDGSVPTINVQTLANGFVQAASHIVNIRYDSLYFGTEVPPEVLQTFYQYYDDNYDFINVVEQVRSDVDMLYYAARNRVDGLGLPIFSRAETYGSNNQLQGIILFPDDGEFDPAATSTIHQVAHRWMNFGNLESIRTGRPHWPISTLAFGITGFTNPTGDAAIFRFGLTRRLNDTYAVRVRDRPRTFNDFELYLMGLLPQDSVQPHIVFLNQDQHSQLNEGGVLSGPLDTVMVADWVAEDGARVPAYPEAQRTFRMATIVLSRGRLLSREEMSFFNHMAERGEREMELTAIEGSTRGTTLPFYLATGRRGRLATQLLPDL